MRRAYTPGRINQVSRCFRSAFLLHDALRLPSVARSGDCRATPSKTLPIFDHFAFRLPSSVARSATAARLHLFRPTPPPSLLPATHRRRSVKSERSRRKKVSARRQAAFRPRLLSLSSKSHTFCPTKTTAGPTERDALYRRPAPRAAIDHVFARLPRALLHAPLVTHALGASFSTNFLFRARDLTTSARVRFGPGVGNSTPTKRFAHLPRHDCRNGAGRRLPCQCRRGVRLKSTLHLQRVWCKHQRAAKQQQCRSGVGLRSTLQLRPSPLLLLDGHALAPVNGTCPPIGETSGLSQRFAIAMSLRRERNPGLLAARPAVILAMSIFCPRFEIAAPAPRKVGRQRFVHPIAVARDPAICHPVGDKRLTFRKDRGSDIPSARIPT